MLNDITPVLLSYNEASNIGRALSHLEWAKDIVIVDSGSKDDTIAVIARYPRARVFVRAFDTHAAQWQYALEETGISTPWVLRLDADYLLTDALIAEMAQLVTSNEINGYRVAFDYAIYSRKLVASLYPPKIVLLRIGRFSIVDQGHTEGWVVKEPVENLAGRIVHDDRKQLSEWFVSQLRYARIEAEHLLRTPKKSLSWPDRVRRMGWPAPALVFFYVLLAKGCIVGGWAGWYYALQRLLAETMIALEVIDRRLRVQFGEDRSRS